MSVRELTLSFIFAALSTSVYAGVGVGPHPKNTSNYKKLWSLTRIPYYYEPTMGSKAVDAIEQAREQWNGAALPIELVRANTRPSGAFIYFRLYDEGNCLSSKVKGEELTTPAYTQYIGFVGNKPHEICLNINIITVHAVLHEVGHVVGLDHEHKHCDAHLYISEFRDAKERFVKCPGPVSESADLIMLTDYDMQSVMHYPPDPSGGRLTSLGNFQAIKNGFDPADIGELDELSPLDREAIRKLYAPP